MNKVSNKMSLRFLIKSGMAIGLTLALADLLTNILYGDKTSLVLNSIKLFFYDFGIAALIVLVLSPFFLLLSKLHFLVAKSLIYTIGFIVLIASLLLNKYYATTHLTLGSDLYGYSISDIKMIVSTSSDVSLLSFWPIFLFVGVFVAAFRFLIIKEKQKIWVGAFLLLAIGFCTF